ncbi:beta-phosphoglucomutase [Lacticaseibacillus zhaodongensis]|uniref:beta-phosphoglucomutase n=1 Tax=Lacticaseibacillus zhaodongensis TaxID=2668065 RepID=UPI0012D30DDD|nr:beta-phosphoglucomutase [Lacticaseibacillus zhaodongensis]
MTSFSDIKGFVFDLDGVITDTARFHSLAWRKVADKVGAHWTAGLAERLKGISRMESLDIILQAAGKQDAYTEDEKVALATSKNAEYLRLVDTLTPDDILPGIADLVQSLDDGGYKLAIASASKNAPRVLQNLGISQYFPNIVDPSTLKHGKPDPEIFIKAAESIGLKPEQCVGVEDAAAGVQGIKAAGEVAVGIGDADVLKQADMVFPSTAELTLSNVKAHMDKDVSAVK